MRIEENIEIGLLFQLYGSLLTDRQRRLVRSRYYDDLSLTEIGDNLGISKQAVADQLDKAAGKLKNYEAELHFLEKLSRLQAPLASLEGLADRMEGEEGKELKQGLREIQGILDLTSSSRD